jgi:hypothetical protein
MAEHQDVDTGEPIALLAELRESPRPGFFPRIRNSIERFRLGSELTELSWRGIALLVLEYLDMVFQLLGGDRRKSKGEE